ncbi:MAG: hypothetical protein Q4G34_05585 [Micrococcus sp.]|nr:hypothetical protein [Micrococcus sp.]
MSITTTNRTRSHLRSITEPSNVMLLRVLGRVELDMIERFGAELDADTVRQTVRDSFAELQSRSTVSQFLVPLTERMALERLHALTDAEHGMDHEAMAA